MKRLLTGIAAAAIVTLTSLTPVFAADKSIKEINITVEAPKAGESAAEKPVVSVDAEGVKVTESGLQYQVVKEGDGLQPGPNDVVTVHYTGMLIDGTVFDSSVERGEPATFAVGQVIPGWVEGLQLMREGAAYRLFIPSNLAYGSHGTGPIQPNSTLIFDVQLLKVEKK